MLPNSTWSRNQCCHYIIQNCYISTRFSRSPNGLIYIIFVFRLIGITKCELFWSIQYFQFTSSLVSIDEASHC